MPAQVNLPGRARKRPAAGRHWTPRRADRLHRLRAGDRALPAGGLCRALADGGKRQTLLEHRQAALRRRPGLRHVSQILAGYSLQGTFSAGTDLLTGGSLRLSDDANVGVGGTFTNNPTVTYAPVTGADFARTFLAPLQPADLFGLMLAGVPPELVLGLGLHSIGGYDNERATPGAPGGGRPGFADVLALLLELQRTGRLASSWASGRRSASPRWDRAGRGDDDAPERRLRQLLELPADRDTFEVVYTLSTPGRARSRSVPAR